MWEAFLELYLAGRAPEDPTLHKRLHLYRGLFPLFWLALLLEVGVRRAVGNNLTGWHINGLSANVRLRRYLAWALAWPAIDLEPDPAEFESVTFFPCRSL